MRSSRDLKYFDDKCTLTCSFKSSSGGGGLENWNPYSISWECLSCNHGNLRWPYLVHAWRVKLVFDQTLLVWWIFRKVMKRLWIQTCAVTCATLVSQLYIWWGMARHGFLWFCSCHTSDSVVCMHAKPSQATPRDTADSRPHTTCGAASELCHSSDRVYGPLPLTTHSALWHTWDNFETSVQRERIQMASLLQLSSPNAILSPCAFILRHFSSKPEEGKSFLVLMQMFEN